MYFKLNVELIHINGLWQNTVVFLKFTLENYFFEGIYIFLLTIKINKFVSGYYNYIGNCGVCSFSCNAF